MGEPAGIGGELTLKAWAARDPNTPPFAALDDPDRLAALATILGYQVTIAPIETVGDVRRTFASALPVLRCPLARPPRPGQPDPACAEAVIGSIRLAVELCQAGDAAAMVTNPIQKSVLAQAGFPHPGHTEFLGKLAGSAEPVMMLAVEGLRVVPVTVHTPLAEVPGKLTAEAIIHAGRVTAADMRRYFGIDKPRLAVAALNPHAGEAGMLGDEEARIIQPAIDTLVADGIAATGPHPADSLFHAAARETYDAAICMYHDQALIPLKALDFYGGVNVTLGLPFVRTSPDHGTALDIAGSGNANAASFVAALHMAADMAAAGA
jgi:4-hydroxythreonine-4-phosphate dehydrogenase